jgi:hypothetical protein
MPWIKLNPYTKQRIAEAAERPFIASETPNGEIFVDSEVYEALTAIGLELGLSFEDVINQILAKSQPRN